MLLQETKCFYDGWGQLFLSILYQALFAAAYYGLLRVGEITSGSHPIFATDVHIAFNKKKIMITLHTSKMHWHNAKPQVVKIKGLRDSTNRRNGCCPFAILRDYASARPTCCSINEPFFIFLDRSPVRPQHMRDSLKIILKKCGFDSTLYSTHSFHAGMASDLLDLGFSVETIKKLGRWKSNSVYAYLR